MDVDRIRCVVNANFENLRQGEVVDVDPIEWAAYIEGGFLSPLGDDGSAPIEHWPGGPVSTPDVKE